MKLRSYTLSGLLLLAGSAVWDSCYYDHESVLYHEVPVDCAKVNATFTTDVQPIINLHCATTSCHNSTGVGNTVLQTYDQIKAKVDRITQRVMVEKTMPPNGSLTASEMSILTCWIENGALNN